MTIREYTLNLLKECDCKLDCYKNQSVEHATKDMAMYEIENGKCPFPIADIGAELVKIGNEQPDPVPPPPAPYRMIYDGDSFIDGIDHESLEGAICDAQDTLIMWMQEEIDAKKWQWDEENCRYHPTEEQIDDWDYMIYNMGCYVVEYTGDEEYDGYTSIDNAVWPRSQEDLDEIGWMLWEDRVKKIEESRGGQHD